VRRGEKLWKRSFFRESKPKKENQGKGQAEGPNDNILFMRNLARVHRKSGG
jgi:hypothetical protein